MVYHLFYLAVVLAIAPLRAMESENFYVPFTHKKTTEDLSLEIEKDKVEKTFVSAYNGLCAGIKEVKIFEVARWVPYFKLIVDQPKTEILTFMAERESPLVIAVKKFSNLPRAHSLQTSDKAAEQDALKANFTSILEMIGGCGLFVSSDWLQKNMTPLCAACSVASINNEEREDLVTFLLECNADPSAVVITDDENGQSPLQIAQKYGYQTVVALLLHEEERRKKEQYENELVMRGPFKKRNGKITFGKKSNESKQEKKLKIDKENIQHILQQKLMTAIDNANLEAVKGCLEMSIAYGYLNIDAEFFDATNNCSYTPLTKALHKYFEYKAYITREDGIYRENKLMQTYFKIYENIVVALLCNGACPNVAYGRSTPLITAIIRDDVALLHLLISHGATLYFKDSRGLSPLEIAQADFPELYEKELLGYVT